MAAPRLTCRMKPLNRQWTLGRRFSRSTFCRTGEVRIVEVGPRDGLQNESKTVPLATKVELIERLGQTGLRCIEAGSFVAPKWVPQMANSADILNHLLGHPPTSHHPVAYNFLVPNLKGLENFLKAAGEAVAGGGAEEPAPITSTNDPNEMPSPPPSPSPPQVEEPAPIASTEDPNEMLSDTSGVGDKQSSADTIASNKFEISVFAAATETFSRANANCTITESLDRFRSIVTLAKSRDLRVRGYVSVALGCPFEGPDVAPSKVADVTASLLEMGVDEVSVADTTGMGTAPKTTELLKVLTSSGISSKDLALHFHDTYGQALVNVVIGLEHGIRTFDSSVGGLGGCPFAKGATGNVATEDLLHCLHSLGATTGIDIDKISKIGSWISGELGRPNESRAGKAVLARLKAV